MSNVFLLVQTSDLNIVLKCMDTQSLKVEFTCQQSFNALSDTNDLVNLIRGFSVKIHQLGFRISSLFYLKEGRRDIADLLEFLRQTFRPIHLFEVQNEDVNLQEIGDLQIPAELKESEELWDICAKLSALGTLNITKSGDQFVGALSLDIQMDYRLTALQNNRLFVGGKSYSPHDFPRCVPMPNPQRSMMGQIILQSDAYVDEIFENYRQVMETEGNTFNVEEYSVPLFLTGDVYSLHYEYVVESLTGLGNKIRFFGPQSELIFHGLIYALDNNMLQNSVPPAPAPSPSTSPVHDTPPAA